MKFTIKCSTPRYRGSTVGFQILETAWVRQPIRTPNMRCEKACPIKGGPYEARHKQLAKDILRGHAVHVDEINGQGPGIGVHFLNVS